MKHNPENPIPELGELGLNGPQRLIFMMELKNHAAKLQAKAKFGPPSTREAYLVAALTLHGIVKSLEIALDEVAKMGLDK